jgi:hypothetical protein
MDANCRAIGDNENRDAQRAGVPGPVRQGRGPVGERQEEGHCRNQADDDGRGARGARLIQSQ